MRTSFARFRHLAIERAKPAPTAAQLAAIEELLGASLPPTFREFLQVANGGYLEYFIDVPWGEGKSEPLSFCSFFSADEGDFCDETLIGEIRSAREYQNVPSGVLPIARDGGGSILYLDLSQEGRGRVIAFVEGLPEWAGLRTESAFVELASSFDEFIGKLRMDRAAVIDHLKHNASNSGHVDATEEWLDIGMPSWRDDSEIVAAVTEARRRVVHGG
ncbi:MAG: SMI1/KNR4 family protein [Planctomycetia bacterium]|nr:SMI1/KNR4 family protein [Planctomycetia bacterium]